MNIQKKYTKAMTLLVLVLIAVFMPTIFAQEQVVNQQEEVNEARVDQGLFDENKEHESSSVRIDDETSVREDLESLQTNEPSKSDSKSELDETFVEEQVTSQTITLYNGLRLVQPKIVESDFTGQLIVEIDPTNWSNATKHLSLGDKDRARRSMVNNNLTLLLDGKPYMKAPMNNARQAIFNITQPFKAGSVISITSSLVPFHQETNGNQLVTSYIDVGGVDIVVTETELMIVHQVDVVAAPSTTATISENYIILDKEEIEVTDTAISGSINAELVYNAVLAKAGWRPAFTTRMTLYDAIRQNGTLVLTSANGSLDTFVDIAEDFSFQFENLDLSNLGSIMFELNNINFDGFGSTPKPSKLIFEPINIDVIQPPSPARIANVPETISFQPTAFSFDLADKKINLAQPFQVEIEATREADEWSLMVDSSGELLNGTQSIEHILYYNNQEVGSEARLVEVANGSSVIPFETDSFQLRLMNPNELRFASRSETYSTLINWTLVVGPEE